ELSGKQVGLLREIVPRLSRIAIFGIPGINAAQFAAAETAARAVALEAEVMEVRVADDFERALEAARTEHSLPLLKRWILILIAARSFSPRKAKRGGQLGSAAPSYGSRWR